MHLMTEKTLLQDSLKELEFHRVLDQIARHCISEPGREIILDTLPSEDIQWLRTEHSLVEELRLVAIRNEHLPIEGLYDMRPMLQKSLIQGAFLTPTELLAVHDTIRASRLLRLYFRDKEELYPAIRAFVEQLHENRFQLMKQVLSKIMPAVNLPLSAKIFKKQQQNYAQKFKKY